MKKNITAILLIFCFIQKTEAQTINSTNFNLSTTTFSNTNIVPKSYHVRFEVENDTLVLVDSFDSNCLPLSSFQYSYIGANAISVDQMIQNNVNNSYECSFFNNNGGLISYKLRMKLIPISNFQNLTVTYRCKNYDITSKSGDIDFSPKYEFYENFSYTENLDMNDPQSCISKLFIENGKLVFDYSNVETQTCPKLCYISAIANDSFYLSIESPCNSTCEFSETYNCYKTILFDTNNFTSLNMKFEDNWYQIDKTNTGILYFPSLPTYLPVSDLKLTVSNLGSNNYLRWTTSSEENVSHFEIFKSSNAKDFQKIGVVNANGNSTTTSYYSFSDNDITEQNLFYKIKAVDIDGKFSESNMVKVSKLTDELIKIFPNPASNEINISLPNQNEYALIISNSIGKVILNNTIQSFYKIENNFLAQGIYFITLIENETGISTKQKLLITE